MWRTATITVLSLPAGLLGFVLGWAAKDLRTGIIAGAAVLAVFFVAGIASLFFIKSYTYMDAFLPVVFAIIWSLILLPFTLGLGVFSAGAFIGSAVLLSACMIIARKRGINKMFLLFPAIVFIYEMLPVTIPGPFDDIFAFSGSVVSLFLVAVKAGLKGKIREFIEQNRNLPK